MTQEPVGTSCKFLDSFYFCDAHKRLRIPYGIFGGTLGCKEGPSWIKTLSQMARNAKLHHEL